MDDAAPDTGKAGTSAARQPRDRRALHDELTREASDLGLYEDPPPDYRAALERARRRRGQEPAAPESRPDR